nr:MAG TPA: hypothetical protein [Caudoviricetes sp.]
MNLFGGTFNFTPKRSIFSKGSLRRAFLLVSPRGAAAAGGGNHRPNPRWLCR